MGQDYVGGDIVYGDNPNFNGYEEPNELGVLEEPGDYLQDYTEAVQEPI